MDYFSIFTQMLQVKGLTDNTIRSYKTYIKPYLSYLSDNSVSPEDASWQSMRDFLAWIQSERCLSDRTINMVISYLQFFHMYVLHKEWDKTQIPFRVFDTFLPCVPSPKEISRLLQAMDNPKLKLATSILYSTGMRLDELCHLKCADISHSSMKIHIRRSKNHSDRYVPLTQSIWDMILRYWLSLPDDKRPRDWLFTQQTRLASPMDKQWFQKNFLELRRSLAMDCRICAHSLRHAYATRCYENGMDLLTLKSFLGHKSLNSTCIYVGLAASYKPGIVNPFDQLGGGDLG